MKKLYFFLLACLIGLNASAWTVKFTNPNGWADVYAYCFDGAGAVLGSWPGTKMTKEGDVWTITSTAGAPGKIIFNGGNGKPQTGNLDFVDGATYDMNGPVGAELNDYVVYFRNDDNWANVYVYTFSPELAGSWPGKKLTKNANGLYEFVIQATSEPSMGGIIFNNNAGTQTANLTYVAGTTYNKNGPVGATLNEYSVYLRNDANWDKVYAYTFSPELAGTWPGTEISKNADGLYVFTVEATSTPTCEGLIFSDGNGNQTSDLIYEVDKTYSNGPEKWFCAYDMNGTWEFGKEMEAQGGGIFKYLLDSSEATGENTFVNVFYGSTNTGFDDGTRYVPSTYSDVTVEDGQTYTMAQGAYGAWVLSNNEWTVTVNTNNSTITFEAGNTVEEGYSFVYFDNIAYWADVNVYAWKDGGETNAPWPGEAAPKCKIGDNYYYYIAAPMGTYDKVIFSGSDGQTADLPYVNGAVYSTDNTPGENPNTTPAQTGVDLSTVALELPYTTTETESNVVLTFDVPEDFVIYYIFNATMPTDVEKAPARAEGEYQIAQNQQVSLPKNVSGTLDFYAEVNGTQTAPASYSLGADGVVTGVNNVEMSENIAPVFYNLQGVRVANPSNGIFIRVQGAKVSKVAL